MNQLSRTCLVAYAALAHEIRRFAQFAEPHGQKEQASQHGGAKNSAVLPEIDLLPPLMPSGEDPSESEALEASDAAMQQIFSAASAAAAGKTDGARTNDEAVNRIKASRLQSLFEEIRLESDKPLESLYVKPLAPLSVESMFPVKRSSVGNSEEYRRLWQDFSGAVRRIPKAMRSSGPLWLDAFDGLCLAYAHAVPADFAGGKSDVSLYDHAKAASAFAAALWRWCDASGLDEAVLLNGFKDEALKREKALLLVQGDFFGIQNFIFTSAEAKSSKTAKILRGRSFYVSLLTEICALRVLEALDLPPTSQIMNAAGKFLIIAPNTPETTARLEAVRREIDSWFIKNTCAEAGIGIAAKSASLEDVSEKHFPELMKSIFTTLERTKLQRFNLFGNTDVRAVLDADYSSGCCAWQGRWPADGVIDGEPSCAVTRDQIRIGEALVRSDLIVILDADSQFKAPENAALLSLPIFGYQVLFARSSAFDDVLKTLPMAAVRRVWDFSMPEKADETLWRGFARRSINGYVPRLAADFNPDLDQRFRNAPLDEIGRDRILSFSWIARYDLRFEKVGNAQGIAAL